MTSAAATLPRSYFRPDGCPYVGIPMSVEDLPDELLAIWRKLTSFVFKVPRVNVRDRILARLLSKSVPTVQRWLRWLEKIGAIKRVRNPDGSRTIWLILGIRGSKPKPKSGNASGPKILGRPLITGEQSSCSSVSSSPSFEGAIRKDQQAVVVGEDDGTSPPPTAEGEDNAEAPSPEEVEARTAAALAALRADLARAAAAPKGPRPAQDATTAPGPGDSPSPAAPIVPGATMAARLRPSPPDYLDRLRAMAATGDRAAIAELATLPTTPAPDPPAEPPEVGSSGEQAGG